MVVQSGTSWWSSLQPSESQAAGVELDRPAKLAVADRLPAAIIRSGAASAVAAAAAGAGSASSKAAAAARNARPGRAMASRGRGGQVSAVVPRKELGSRQQRTMTLRSEQRRRSARIASGKEYTASARCTFEKTGQLTSILT